ncbi:Alpha/beta hydrolase family protein [Sphingobium faniae]|nr:Alpha/beta hydrolase family protein [Sphingobium faniae]
MALLNLFPNYVWNLSVAVAIECGGKIGEIIDICHALKAVGGADEDAGTSEFMRAWIQKADVLSELAEDDFTKNRTQSAGEKLKRASLYCLIAERMQHGWDEERQALYTRMLKIFEQAVTCLSEPVDRVTIDYDDGRPITGWFHRAATDGPCVIFCNGLDSVKEMLYLMDVPKALAMRGISTLCVDQPGTGEALRLQGIPATHRTERWVSRWVDWLQDQPGIDPARIGMLGISLGGYYVSRAVAFEPRLALGAAWGANHNWIEVQHKRLRREGENPVPHYWDHVSWVFGADSVEDFFDKAKGMTLEGVLDRIKAPFLVTHGARDRQIDVGYAHLTFDQLINSRKRKLKIFSDREGGVEHVSVDNMSFARDYISDWIHENI